MKKLALLVLVISATFISLFLSASADGDLTSDEATSPRRSENETLCSQLLAPAGYPCTEYTVQTEDGYLLAVQRVSSRNENLQLQQGRPVLLVHGLFMSGDAWFLNTPEQSPGFILADEGYDVWVGSVRGTTRSRGHISLSDKDKEFWDWSLQELALYDLAAMVDHVYQTTNSKVLIVGHSQGTIISLAAFTEPKIVEKVEAAALLSPISYLGHANATIPHIIASMHIDEMFLAMGIHELNLRREILVSLMDSICEGHKCNDYLTPITGKNCCFNNSRVAAYLDYLPQPSSAKNLNHLCQMMRKGTFSRYDYGATKNLKIYGQVKPPAFDLRRIPKTLPLWMCHGGHDNLADVTDVQHTLEELLSKPELVYLENYGHIDFILSVRGKEDMFDNMIEFFRSLEKSSSS